jgi:hypothetical protein
MSTNMWHASPDALGRYVNGRGDPAESMSLDAHLMHCAECREAVARLSAADEALDETLDEIWVNLNDRLTARPRSPLARVLVRCGVSDAVARLVAATPALRLPWLFALAFSLMVAAGITQRTVGGNVSAEIVFLTIAPLAPLAGIAVSFGPRLDPSHEMAGAAAMAGFRLLMWRAVAVLVTSMAIGLVAAAFLPGPWWTTVAWLLPALALSASAIALLPRFPAVVVGTGLAVAWIAVVVAWQVGADGALAPFSGVAQLLYLAAAVIAGIVVLTTKPTLDMWVQR